MPKIDDARKILSLLGMPSAQQNDKCCYSLLALAAITEASKWKEATNNWIRIHDIIQFIETTYAQDIAENTRETIRKQAMHNFRNAAIIEDNGKATNSPNYQYRITSEALALLKEFGGKKWDLSLESFLAAHKSLVELYSSKKKMTKMPVNIDGIELELSTGKHNQLQKLILEEFAPRFAPFSNCLYMGDTENKDLHKDSHMLQHLGFSITLHDKMPDIVLYREDKKWLYFIEAVTSVGPIDNKRLTEIEAMTKNVKTGKI